MSNPKKAPKVPASEAKKEAPTATLPEAPEAPKVPEAPTEAPSGFAPYVRPSGSGFAPRVPGFLGYGKGTGTEALALAFGKPEGATKAEALSAYLSVTGKAEKPSKTSLSVFLSDSVRPFGRYYASRSLILEANGETLRFSPASIEAAEKALSEGALEALKLIPEKDRNEKAPKFRAFLSRFGFGALR